MRTLRLCVCLLVFVTLFIFGCSKKGGKNLKQVPVTLSNCKANPDPVYVNNGDKIDWEASDGHDYTISFADKSEPTPNPFKVHHGASNPAHPVMGNKGCTPQNNGHYCKYSLTMDNQSTACADPGLHVTP